MNQISFSLVFPRDKEPTSVFVRKKFTFVVRCVLSWHTRLETADVDC